MPRACLLAGLSSSAVMSRVSRPRSCRLGPPFASGRTGPLRRGVESAVQIRTEIIGILETDRKAEETGAGECAIALQELIVQLKRGALQVSGIAIENEAVRTAQRGRKLEDGERVFQHASEQLRVLHREGDHAGTERHLLLS